GIVRPETHVDIGQPAPEPGRIDPGARQGLFLDKVREYGRHPQPAAFDHVHAFHTYLAESPTAAIPASAHASSWSDVSPVMPTAPIVFPSLSATSTPPAAGTMPAGARLLNALTKVGRSAAISPTARLDTPSASAVDAFPMAICGRMVEAPSCRSSAIR